MPTRTPKPTLGSASTLVEINAAVAADPKLVPEAIAILDARAARKLAKGAQGNAAKATHAADQLREGAKQIDTKAANKAQAPFSAPREKRGSTRKVLVTPAINPEILLALGRDPLAGESPAMTMYLALCTPETKE